MKNSKSMIRRLVVASAALLVMASAGALLRGDPGENAAVADVDPQQASRPGDATATAVFALG